MEYDLNPLMLTIDGGEDADDEDRAELTRGLRQQLLDADVESVEFSNSEAAPAGSKGGLGPLGALAVSVRPPTIPPMIGSLEAWLARHDRASITVANGDQKITLSGPLTNEQKEMVAEVLNRPKI